MTYEQVNGIIAEIATALGVDYAYSAFQDSVERNRFLVWYYGDRNDLFADCVNYASIECIVIEFYSRKKKSHQNKKFSAYLHRTKSHTIRRPLISATSVAI